MILFSIVKVIFSTILCLLKYQATLCSSGFDFSISNASNMQTYVLVYQGSIFDLDLDLKFSKTISLSFCIEMS